MNQESQSSLPVAIVGAGLMGRWHAHFARRLGADLVAIVDSDIRAAEALAGTQERAVVFDNLPGMLAAAHPQAVHICTPLPSHLSLASTVIEAGAHVLVEKPLTPDEGSTRRLLDAAAVAGVIVCPVHQFGFQDGVQKAVHALEKMGVVLQIQFTICSAGAFDRGGNFPDEVLADILPHPFSVMRILWPGRELNSDAWMATHPGSGELHVDGMFGDAGFALYISMNARPTRCEMDVLCTRGRIHLDFFHGFGVIERGLPSRFQKITQPFKYAYRSFFTAGRNITRRALRRESAYPGLACLLENFYAAVRGATGSPVPPDDTLIVARVRDQIIARAMPHLLAPQQDTAGHD